MFDQSILFDAIEAHGMLVEAKRLGQPGPGNTFRCGFQQPDVLVLGDAVQTGDMIIEFVASEAPGLKAKEVLEIDTQRYRVRNAPMRKGDGYFVTAVLEVVGAAP